MGILKKFLSVVLIFCLIFCTNLSIADTAGGEDSVPSNPELDDEILILSAEFASEYLSDGEMKATIRAENLSSESRYVKTTLAHFNYNNKLVNVHTQSDLLVPGVNTYEISIEIKNSSLGDQLRLYVWKGESFETLKPLTTVKKIEFDNENLIYYQDFRNATVGQRLNPIVKISDFLVNTTIEANNSTYTSKLGSQLYASIEKMPAEANLGNKNAVYLYDNVIRTSPDAEGKGAAVMYVSLPELDDPYILRFKMFVPDRIGTNKWGGFTLSSGLANSVAKKDSPCALQVKFSPQVKKINGVDTNTMQLNTYNSILYNDDAVTSEGYAFLAKAGNNLLFNRTWQFELLIDPKAKKITTFVTDGITSDTEERYYNIYDEEKVYGETWENKKINTLAFNSGWGTRGEMYVTDIEVYRTKPEDDETKNYETVEFQDFDEFEANTIINDTNPVGNWRAFVLKEESSYTYERLFGSRLYANIINAPTVFSNSANKVLHIYDYATRESSDQEGRAGIVVARQFEDFGINSYKIRFKLYTRSVGGTWDGIHLSSGYNIGKGDNSDENPIALQLKFSPQSNGERMQFDIRKSYQYNGGNASAFLGTGNSRYYTNRVWDVEFTVHPKTREIDVQISDGTYNFKKTTTYNGSASLWQDKKIDTISFVTGAGGTCEMFVDDFEIINTNTIKHSRSALNSIVRFEAHDSVTSAARFLRYVNEDGKTSLRLRIDQMPEPIYHAKFVERPGLYDPNGVSIESDSPYRKGYFLVRNSDNSITLAQNDGTESFARRATFYKVSGLNDSNHSSYQVYDDPTRYICHSNNGLRAEVVSDYNSRGRATWKVRAENSPKLGDRFDGSSLDTSKWRKGYVWGDSHNYSAVVRDSQVVVDGGELILKAERVNSIQNSKGEWGYWNNIKGRWTSYKFKTGAVSGVSTSGWNYTLFNGDVYLEGSFKLPSEYGFWPAFWLNCKDDWPPEIDIFEYLTDNPRYMYTVFHIKTNGQDNSRTKNYHVGEIWKDYHKFALDWNSEYVAVYFDDHVAFYNNDKNYIKGFYNLYTIINLGVGGWAEEPSGSTNYAEMKVKYIRSFDY